MSSTRNARAFLEKKKKHVPRPSVEEYSFYLDLNTKHKSQNTANKRLHFANPSLTPQFVFLCCGVSFVSPRHALRNETNAESFLQRSTNLKRSTKKKKKHLLNRVGDRDLCTFRV